MAEKSTPKLLAVRERNDSTSVDSPPKEDVDGPICSQRFKYYFSPTVLKCFMFLKIAAILTVHESA